MTLPIIELKHNTQRNKHVDVTSFGLVARGDGEIIQAVLDVALSEVQGFYDKKKN